MEPTFLSRQIRRICRNAIIRWIVILAALGALFHFALPHPKNVFGTAPEIHNLAELRQAYANRELFVRLGTLKIINTGYSIGKSGSADEYYHAAQIPSGDAAPVYLLFKSSRELEPSEGKTIALRLGTPTRLESELREKVVGNIAKETQVSREEASRRVPEELLAHTSTQTQARFLAGAILAAAAFILFRIFRNASLMGRPEDHPACKKIEQQTQLQYPLLSAELDREMAGGQKIDLGKMTLLPHYLVLRLPFGLKIRRSSDLLWLFPVTTRHRTNGIPTGKSHSITFHFNQSAKDVQSLGCPSEKKKMLWYEEIVRRYPHAIAGYSPELEALCTSNFAKFLLVKKGA